MLPACLPSCDLRRDAADLKAAARGFARRHLARSAAAWVALSVAILVAACGGGEEKKKPPPKSAEAALSALAGGGGGAAAAAETSGAYIVLGENPKWKPIKPLFEAYKAREVEGLANWSLENLVAFIEKPVVQETVDPTAPGGATDENGDPALELPDTCGTKGPLERYSLFMIMTGVAQPKAVFADVSGNRCEVIRGDALGNEGGRVVAITQYKVILSLPGKEKPVTLSIAPPISVLDPLEQEDSDVP